MLLEVVTVEVVKFGSFQKNIELPTVRVYPPHSHTKIHCSADYSTPHMAGCRKTPPVPIAGLD